MQHISKNAQRTWIYRLTPGEWLISLFQGDIDEILPESLKELRIIDGSVKKQHSDAGGKQFLPR